MAGDPVGAEAADDGGDTAADDLLDADLGRSGRRATLAAAADEVDMRVDHARKDQQAGRVDLVDLETAEGHRSRIGQREDLISRHQNIERAQGFGREYLASADQCDHPISS
jgi:hypothetical protein